MKVSQEEEKYLLESKNPYDYMSFNGWFFFNQNLINYIFHTKIIKIYGRKLQSKKPYG